MARQNRKHRHEARYGRPDTLADILMEPQSAYGVPDWQMNDPGDPHARSVLSRNVTKIADVIRRTLPLVPRVRFDAVARWYYQGTDQTSWDWATEFPGCKPPWGSFWMETKRPDGFRDEHGLRAFSREFCERWGFCCDEVSRDDHWVEPATGPAIEWREGLQVLWDRYPTATTILRMGLAILDYQGAVVPHMLTFLVPLNLDGDVLGHPSTATSLPRELTGFDDQARERAARATRDLSQLCQTGLLALSLMNCRNVDLTAVEPDPAINRERKRGKLAPFLRYSTVTIRPTRRAGRPDQGETAEGRRQAWHRVRGHFRTYTPEAPLFGRQVGRFWIPQHTAGDIDEGAVITRYQVEGPAPREIPR